VIGFGGLQGLQGLQVRPEQRAIKVIPASQARQPRQVRSAQQARQVPKDPLDLGDPRGFLEIPHNGETASIGSGVVGTVKKVRKTELTHRTRKLSPTRVRDNRPNFKSAGSLT